MSDNNDHKEQRMGLWIAGGAAALATLVTLFLSVWGWETGKIEGSPNYGQASAVVHEHGAAGQEASAVEHGAHGLTDEAASAVAHDHGAEATASAAEHGHGNDVAASGAVETAAANVKALTDDVAAVFVENGIVKFYFASGKADLAQGAQEALKDVLAGVKEGKKAVISGFHDSTGNQALNEELSKQRALAVKNALLGFGVAEEQIELRKPADAEAGQGNNAEARRVEVVLE